MSDKSDKNPDNSPLLPHGGYEKLRSYRVAEAVYDATVVFCDRFIEKRSRTHDQMVQAARSGVRNISEGSGAAATSRKSEMKLTNVARASLNSPNGPPCPLCGKPTRQRTAAKGPRAGQAFWGCSAYPDCRGIVDIPSDMSDKSDPSDRS